MTVQPRRRRSGRTPSPAARLARLGFADPARAEALLSQPPLAGLIDDDILEALSAAADPDLAMRSLCRVLSAAEVDPTNPLPKRMADDRGLAYGLIGVLGVSEAAADHLVRHPADALLLDGQQPRLTREQMRTEVVTAVGGDPRSGEPTGVGPSGELGLSLRRSYRRILLRIARADVVDAVSYDIVSEDLSAAADAALEAALAIARSEVGESSRSCRLAVIAMGKCGGQELNYVSDVDVIFVAEARDCEDAVAIRVGTSLATSLMRACNASTSEGSLWEVDPGLRPEGKSGVLVRTLDSHIGYYERWAQTWEFQALLKARAAAGDIDLGQRYVDATAELVWSASGRQNFVEDVQAMRRRVERSVEKKSAGRQLKLGRGGLRDVEFSVQLLQLVHGRGDQMVRSPNTMRALEALANYGYVGRKDAAGLASAYRFLRTLEHRLQLYRWQRVHVVPDSTTDIRRIARSLGYRKDPIEEFDVRWRETGLEVRRLHEKLFYRPLLLAVARLRPGEVRLTLAAAGERLEALGFDDPTSALRHLEALTSGVTRRAAIQRTLLPVLLAWFADSPDPDAALFGFRRVSEALGSTPWYLRLLRDESVAAQRLADILGSSRYTTDLLLRAPEAVSMLASGTELGLRNSAALESEALASVSRHDDPVAAIGAVRAFRRRELFRLSVSDILNRPSVEETAAGLSDVTAATVTAAMQTAVAEIGAEHRGKLGIRFLVMGMGRFGGADMSYASDADVMFVYDPLPGADDETASRQALAVANELIRLLALPSPDPPLLIDSDLRPEGRSGPLVRSLASYAAYYERWAAAWESQALLRARPVSGDPGLGDEFVAIIDPLRYPQGGLAAADLLEMRRLKARMESERLPRGADPAVHTKLGPGGLSDVEWTVQLLQMQHARSTPSLRVTQTIPALVAATEAGLIQQADSDALAEAWRVASRIRNATVLATGKPSDMIPGERKPRASVAHLMGYAAADSQLLVQDYRRAARRARKVMEGIFYGV